MQHCAILGHHTLREPSERIAEHAPMRQHHSLRESRGTAAIEHAADITSGTAHAKRAKRRGQTSDTVRESAVGAAATAEYGSNRVGLLLQRAMQAVSQ